MVDVSWRADSLDGVIRDDWSVRAGEDDPDRALLLFLGEMGVEGVVCSWGLGGCLG